MTQQFKNKGLRHDFWRWVLASSGGYAAGGLLAGLLSTGVSGSMPGSALWAGMMIGLWQYWVLRQRVRYSAAWIGMTAISFLLSEWVRGLMFPLLITMLSPTPALSNQPPEVTVIGGVLSYSLFYGTGVGGTQWLFWRWQWPRLSLNWVGWTILGHLAVVLVLVLVPPVSDRIRIGGTGNMLFLGWQMVKLAGAGALLGAITGSVLIRLPGDEASVERI